MLSNLNDIGIAILEELNPIRIVLFFTFIHALSSLKRRIRVNRYLLIILFVGVFSEILDPILRHYNLNFTYAHMISTFLFHIFWLLILREFITKRQFLLNILYSFIIFFSANFIIIVVTGKYNFYSFVLGSMIYTVFFIKENYRQMKAEALQFFISDFYLLIFSPLLFMLGLSLILSFAKAEIVRAEMFWGITLYKLFVNLACLVYYSLINIYIYRQRKQLKYE